MDSELAAKLADIEANQESIISKLDTLLAANEKLDKERAELQEQMKSSGLGAILSAMEQ